MSEYVVDACTAIKWYLPEIHDVAAQRLLALRERLHVPDLFFSEIGNILWKHVRAGKMIEDEAQSIVRSLSEVPLAVYPGWPLIGPALEIACKTQRTVYDSLYLALAVQERVVMVTADERFYNAIKATPLERYVMWVEDTP